MRVLSKVVSLQKYRDFVHININPVDDDLNPVLGLHAYSVEHLGP